MRALICAIAGLLAVAGAAMAQDVPAGTPLGSPERPLPSQRWITAGDMVADCRHPASPDIETDCRFQVLLPIAYFAADPLPGAEVPPPGISDPVWSTGQDLVADCQHASGDLLGRCDFEVLLGVVQLRQAQPGKFCMPRPSGDMSQKDSDRWFHDRIEQPVYDWIAVRPGALARPWGESIAMAALALWPCS